MSRSILIVDDEPGMVTALSIRFRAAGYTVDTASDGMSGIEMARRIMPDAIVLDLRMPDVDGDVVCREIRRDPATARTPILLLSASVEDDVRRRATESGANRHLLKPFNAAEVLQVVTDLIETEHARVLTASHPGGTYVQEGIA